MTTTSETSNVGCSVGAGFVTFNPDLALLSRGLEATLPQVGGLAVVDNASRNLGGIVDLCQQLDPGLPRIQIVENSHNLGIAVALNQLSQWAVQSGHDWLLTLDQDSVPLPRMVETYMNHAHHDRLGAIACRYPDWAPPSRQNEQAHWSLLSITSGLFTKVEAFKAGARYDPTMFIDSVDFDFNHSLDSFGYRVLQLPTHLMEHSLGGGYTSVRLFGKDRRVTTYAPFRTFYQVRNAIYTRRKWGRTGGVVAELRQVVGRVMTGPSRVGTIVAACRGAAKGLTTPIHRANMGPAQ